MSYVLIRACGVLVFLGLFDTSNSFPIVSLPTGTATFDFLLKGQCSMWFAAGALYLAFETFCTFLLAIVVRITRLTVIAFKLRSLDSLTLLKVFRLFTLIVSTDEKSIEFSLLVIQSNVRISIILNEPKLLHWNTLGCYHRYCDFWRFSRSDRFELGHIVLHLRR